MLLRISKRRLFSFNKIWISYFLIKVFYLFFAMIIVSEFTMLGDTFRYLGGQNAWDNNWFYSSTAMMDSFAGAFSKIFGPYLGSFPFIVMSFVGIYCPVSKINMNNKQLLGILALLSLPSFGIWTSIASKEAVSVFFMGMLLAAYIDVYERRPIKNKLMFFLSVYLCLVFKPQYMIGVLAIFSFSYLSRKFILSAVVKFFLFLIIVGLGSAILYYFRDLIDELTKTMPAHFSQDGGSTRENTIWIEQYDFFKNAVYGMYIAFVGPTIQEALSKPFHMMVWIESMVILGVFGMLTLKYFFTSAYRSRVNVMFICGFSLVTFWILLVHYPFGVLNYGSAIRYRESYYAFLVCLFFFLYRKAMAPSSPGKYNKTNSYFDNADGHGVFGSHSLDVKY